MSVRGGIELAELTDRGDIRVLVSGSDYDDEDELPHDFGLIYEPLW